MPVDQATTERIRAAYQRSPSAMTMQLARELAVPEAEVMGALPEMARPLNAARWEELIRAFEKLGKVHVICSNAAVTLESFGEFGNFSKTGPFFNVQTASLDMHIRHQQIGRIFAVEKPGHMDGFKTYSIQFFDLSGASAFKVFLTFGGSAPPPEKARQFEELVAEFKS